MKKWFVGVRPEKRRKTMDEKIRNLIPFNQEVSWSVLAERARAQGIGKATLSRHLKKLEKLGIIRRRVDTSVYPPRTYYKHLSPEKIRLYIPYEAATGLFGDPPSKDSNIEEVKKWVEAQTRLLLAKIILEVSPNPLLHHAASDREIENFAYKHFLERNRKLLENMARLHALFTKIAASDEERMMQIQEKMLLEYYEMFEQALAIYGLSTDKIMDKIKGGKGPVLKPLFPISLSQLQGQPHNEKMEKSN